ncbi:MAG: MlaD family protein [bacterium]
MKKISNETKVGMVVFLAFIFLLTMVLLVGKFNLFEKGYNFSLIFDYAAGLKAKTGVYLGGVKVGKVVFVKIAEKEDKNFVIVKIWVPDEIKIRKNAQFYVNTLGLMGEKIIDISQGTRNFPLIEKNEVFKGKEPINYAILGDMIEDITKKMQQVVEKISTDEKSQDKIKKIVDNIYQATEKLNTLLDEKHLGEVVANSKKNFL